MFLRVSWTQFRRTATWSALVLLLAALGYGLWQLSLVLFPPTSESHSADTQMVRFVLPQDPVTDFPVQRVSEAGDALNPSELVLGVTIGHQSRAYPINMLNDAPRRKILNDRLGGRPIAATW
jgi:hypothetical protein